MHGTTIKIIFLITFWQLHISREQVKFFIYVMKMAVAISYET